MPKRSKVQKRFNVMVSFADCPVFFSNIDMADLHDVVESLDNLAVGITVMIEIVKVTA